MACVTHIAARGADWFKSIGVPADPNNPRDAGSYGPKLYCISGHVNKPGCYEQPLGITCRQLIDEFGGGVWKGRKAKAAVPGGISMGLLSAEELDTPLDFSSLGKVGCLGLGTAAVTVMDETTSMIDFLHNTCRFFAHESCGQCTPCREGSLWMSKALDRMTSGRGRKEDADYLLDIATNILGRTICAFGEACAWPVLSFVKKFKDEFEAKGAADEKKRESDCKKLATVSD
jgi:NADH-quinone oxidoreductase subunit F